MEDLTTTQPSTWQTAKEFISAQKVIIGLVLMVLVIMVILYMNKEMFVGKDEFDLLIDRIHKRQGLMKK